MANFNLFDDDNKDDNTEAKALACRYMRLMSDRVRMHVSQPATRKWVQCFRMILKSFTVEEAWHVLECVEKHLPRTNYTRVENLREQFGPLLEIAKTKAPHMFVELPELPHNGRWVSWAADFAIRWPSLAEPADVVLALRYQLYVFNACSPTPCGWPLAASWLDARLRLWSGWARCPSVLSRSVYWFPDCKDVETITTIMDPKLAKAFINADFTG